MFAPLRVKEYRSYWIGQTISLIGTWMQQIAQGWLVYVLTKSAFYLGFVSFLSTFPMLIFTLFGGVVADRYSRKKILILTQAMSLLPAIFLAIIIHLGIVQIWHVAVASFILGVAAAFDMPARQAFITEIVSKDMITSAIAMQSISFNIARIVGPILAGFIVTQINFHMCFYLNALSFLPLIIILMKISHLNIQSDNGDLSVKHFFKEGFIFLFTKKKIFYTICAVGAFTIFGISFIPFLPMIAEQVLKKGADGYGMLVSSIGLGSLLAATFIVMKKDIEEKENHIFKASLFFPVGLLGIALSKNFYVTIVFAFLLGFTFVNFFTVSNSFIQHHTEGRMRGRVMSFFAFVFLGFTPIGNIFTGWLVEHLGIKTVISTYAFICFIFSLLFFKILPLLSKRNTSSN